MPLFRPLNASTRRGDAGGRLAPVLIAAMMVPCHAGEDEAPMLMAQRWQEPLQGLSFLPPADAVQYPWPDTTSRTLFRTRRGFSIAVSIRRRRSDTSSEPRTSIIVSPGEEMATDRYHFEIHTGLEEITLERVEEMALNTMEVLDATCVFRDRADLTPRDVPAAALYFHVRQPRHTLARRKNHEAPWMLGLAFAPLRKDTFVVFKLQADTDRYPQARRVFEAVVTSLQVENPGVLERRRGRMVERGDIWVQMLGSEQIRPHLNPLRWLRLRRGDSDVGWVRVREQETDELGMQGVGILTDTHLISNDRTFDSVEECFASYDGKYEIWSRRMTVRPHDAAGRVAPTSTIATMNETGTRSGDVIQIHRNGPEGVEAFSWNRPEQAYLPQAIMRLMRRMLPHDQPNDVAFYSYHPNARAMLLRTVHVTPGTDGAYTVTTRPGPDHPDDVTRFDAKGLLQRRDLHGNVALVATDEEELRRLWNLPDR